MFRGIFLFVYNTLFVLLLIASIALLVVTPIDTIRQSRASGQFWDVIIIVCAYVIVAIIAFFFYLQRVLNVRQSMSNIPKRYMLHADDIPSECSALIVKERQRCKEIVEKTQPKGKISHPGLMNPKLAHEEASSALSTPYEEIILTAVEHVLNKTQILHEAFAKPVGMSFRDYLLMLESYKILEMPKSLVSEVIQTYERVRFSGKPISEEDFSIMMEDLMKILSSIHTPVAAQSVSGSSSMFSSYDPYGHSSHPNSSHLNNYSNAGHIYKLRSGSGGRNNTGLTKSDSYESLKESLLESLKESQRHSNADRLKMMAQHYQQAPLPPGYASQYGLSRPSTLGSTSYSLSPSISRNNSYIYSHGMYPVHTLSPLHSHMGLGDIAGSSASRSDSSLQSEQSVVIHRPK